MPIESFRRITQDGSWHALASSVLKRESPLPGSIEDFETHWIEAGHHIRSQVNDDEMLCEFLRLALPPYIGTEMVLYRGENADRYKAGNLGLAWTPNRKTAEMFASGLNAINSGGLLLEALFPANAVIAGPNAHSRYLGEMQFTVEPKKGQNIKILHHYKG